MAEVSAGGFQMDPKLRPISILAQCIEERGNQRPFFGEATKWFFFLGNPNSSNLLNSKLKLEQKSVRFVAY